MADITAKLIWYRLGELYNTTAMAWHNTRSSSFDVLDVLFLAWCGAGLAAILIANFVFDLWRAKPPALDRRQKQQQQQHRHHLNPISEEAAPGAAPASGESCSWLNTLITWYFLNKNAQPAFIDAWLSALNYAIDRRAGQNQLIFEEILVGSLPPQILRVKAEHADDTHNLELQLGIRADDIRFRVRISQSEVCDAVLLGLHAEVSMDLRLCPLGFHSWLRLNGQPQMQIDIRNWRNMPAAQPTLGRPTSLPISDAKSTSDSQKIAAEIAAAIGAAVTEISLTDSHGNRPSSQASLASSCSGCFGVRPLPRDAAAAAAAPAAACADAACQTEAAAAADVQPLLQKQRKQQLHKVPKRTVSAANATISEPQAAARPLLLPHKDSSRSRILVKIIRASGLAQTQTEAKLLNSYACVELDEPYQRHVTACVAGAANPYWDQHYVLDLNSNSRRVSLHIFDRQQQSDKMLGAASLTLGEVPAQGSRIVLPLRKPRRTGAAASAPTPGSDASLTAEFLFVSTQKFSGAAGSSDEASLSTSESADTVIHVQQQQQQQQQLANSASFSSGVGSTSSPTSSPGSGGDGAVAGVAAAAAAPIAGAVLHNNNNNVIINSSYNNVHNDSSLTQAVDDFMQATENNLHTENSGARAIVAAGSSSTTAAANDNDAESLCEVNELSPEEATHFYSPIGASVDNISADKRRGADAAAAAAGAASAGDFDYTQSLPVLNLMPAEQQQQQMSGGRKVKDKKSNRSRSFASKFRRAFGGGGSSGSNHKRSPSVDQVSLPADSRLRPSVGAAVDNNSGDAAAVVQQNLTPDSTLRRSKYRSLSSSLRKLFGSKRKRKRNESETQQANDGHISGKTGWNSEEIL